MDAEQIVRALAATDPATVPTRCGLCIGVIDLDADPRGGAFRHDPDCPWRLTREWVAANPS